MRDQSGVGTQAGANNRTWFAQAVFARQAEAWSLRKADEASSVGVALLPRELTPKES